MSGLGIDSAAERLLERLGFGSPYLVKPLTGGANNRVYQVDSSKGSVVVKSYFHHPEDPRNRFQAERDFYEVAESLQGELLARAHGWDEVARLGVFERITGQPVPAGAINDPLLEQALGFICRLQSLRSGTNSQAINPGSEACFSVQQHLDLMQVRLKRLHDINADSPLQKEAQAFVQTQLLPLWEAVLVQVQKNYSEEERLESVSEGDRCLSPSDFGFHNCLILADGTIRFFDFEYAGWDDPAKLICDFFCQPRIPIPHHYFDQFTAVVAQLMEHPATVVRRARALLPVYQLKWCAIILNEFTPIGLSRRGYAFGDGLALEKQQLQLSLARKILSQINLNERN